MTNAIIAQATNGTTTVYVFHRQCWQDMLRTPGMADYVDRNLFGLCHTANDPLGKCSHTACTK